MDDFSVSQRIVALKVAKRKMEEYLDVFKQEELDAFKVVYKLDVELQKSSNPRLLEERRQKFVWASGLKWNVIGQQKQIALCERAIAEEEGRIMNSSSIDCCETSRAY